MIKEELRRLKVTKVVDSRGTSPSGLLLAARKFIAEVPRGEIMEVYSSDESSSQDLPLWASKAGHEYLGAIEYPGYKGIFIRSGS